MSRQAAVSVRRPTRPRVRRRLARAAFTVIGAVGVLAADQSPVQAQGAPDEKPTPVQAQRAPDEKPAPVQAQGIVPDEKPGLGFLITGGKVVPTGAQREVVRSGDVSAAQLSYGVHPAVSLTATFGWGRSRDVASADQPKLDIFMYDLGAEFRAPRLGSGYVDFRPFAGLGAGARSYNYRSLEVDATHNLSAYGSAGGEMGVGPVRLRLEARDYVTRFKPLDGRPGTSTRNDVVVMFGLLLGR